MSDNCKHNFFYADVKIAKTEDGKRFLVELKINCNTCGTPFSFIGLPHGLSFDGAAVDVDGAEARLAIAPREEVLTVLEDTPDDITARRPS